MHDDLTLPLDDQQRAAAEASPPRDRWGSFRLIERVGFGGFGEVYRAWDPSLEREVALKLLLPGTDGTQQTEEDYKSLLREARALASVRHANIVSVYGIDRHGDGPDARVGFWMDFVKGRTLSGLLATQGPFGYREAALIGLDVARALSAVHRAGLLHRDIKAENVMREEGGRILLMDLGLSSLKHGQTNSSGTPAYMAPELWRGGSATVESDIYAVGVLLYFLVTGEHPVRLGGLSAKEAAEAMARRRPLMDLRPDLPESFLRTVGTAMEIDPAKRFQSAGQLAAALAECLGTSAPAESALAPPTHSNRGRILWPAAAVLLLGTLGLAAWKSPVARRWLHLPPAPVADGISTTANEQYIKAQDLLTRSYKDANVSQAIAIFQKLVDDDPSFALAEAGLGTGWFTQYRNTRNAEALDKAKAATDKALAMDKDLAPALATRARMEAMGGHADLALQDAQKAVQNDSRSPEAYGALADVYNALGRRPDAIEAVQKAIDLAPDNSMWPVKLGNYYMSAGDLNAAAAQWRSAVQIDPRNVFAEFNLGVVNMRLNKLADAEADFQAVLHLGPDAATFLALGTIFLLEGKYSDAIAMDRKAIELDGSNQIAWANLGSAYAWSGGKHEEKVRAYTGAIAIGEKSRSVSPDDPVLLADLADYYASIGNTEKGLPLARKSLALAPDDPTVLYITGDAYEEMGQRARAIPLIAKAVAQGFRVNEFQRSPELAALRSDPNFADALKKAKEDMAVDNRKKIN
jgi:serine/threonine protein kinase/Flp pilus assembly protein TadD